MNVKKYDVVTAFDACVDLLVRGDAAPQYNQAEQLMDGYLLEMGGSACIFACQCARLGLRSAGVGAVGDDTYGSFVLQKLASCGVDVSNVRRDGCMQTGLGLALCRPDGNRAILTVPGSIDSADPGRLLALLPEARHLHIASYYLLKKMRPHWPEILREAKRLGLTVSLDSNWDPAERWDGVMELFPYLDIFFPNENELVAFTGESRPEAAARLLAGKVPLVAAKLGEKGAMAMRSDGQNAFCPAMKVEVADTVGAGDTFDAGFLYGYLNGWSLEGCLRLGVFCAGRSVRAAGGLAGQPGLAEATEWLDLERDGEEAR